MRAFLMILTGLFLMELSPVATAYAEQHVLPLKGKDLFTGEKLEIRAKSKGSVVVFLSSTCPCSNSHTGELKKLVEDYPEFSFVGVHSNTDEEVEMTKSYFKRLQANFPIIRDENLELANQFRALKTPHAYVLNPAGEVIYQGGMSDSPDFPSSSNHYLRDSLESLNQGEKVKMARTRTLGCTITR